MDDKKTLLADYIKDNNLIKNCLNITFVLVSHTDLCSEGFGKINVTVSYLVPYELKYTSTAFLSIDLNEFRTYIRTRKMKKIISSVHFSS